MAGMSSEEVVELLGNVPVFSTLVHDDLERIAQFAVPREFEPDVLVQKFLGRPMTPDAYYADLGITVDGK